MNKVKLKKNAFWIVPLALAVVHYIFSVCITPYVFNMSEAGRNYYFVVAIEFLTFGSLFLLYFFVYKFINKFKKYKKSLLIFLIYFVILLALLFLVRPGNWRWDEFAIINSAKDFGVLSWQHVLTSIFYIISLKIIPKVFGIVIIQCLLISVIVSYILTKIIDYFKIKKFAFQLLCLVPFLLFPILDNNLYPIRCTLYSYIFILTIFYVAAIIYEKRKVSLSTSLLLSFFTIIVSTWRSEGIFFVFIIFIILFVLFLKKSLTLPVFLTSVILSIVGVLGVNALNNSYYYGPEAKSYKITATVEGMTALVRKEAEVSQDSEILNKINKVVDVSMILNNSEMSGEDLFWSGFVRVDYSEDDYSEYMQTYMQLILNYPFDFLKQCLKNFLVASGISTSKSNMVSGPGHEDELIGNRLNFANIWGESILRRGNVVRKKILYLLEGRDINNPEQTNILTPLLWNVIPPMICIIAFCVYLLIKKQFLLALLFATPLMKTVLVFITAPGSYFMYYFAEYLLGYICLLFFIILFVKRLRQRKGEHKK